MSLLDDFNAAMNDEDPAEALERFVKAAARNGIIWFSGDLWQRLLRRGFLPDAAGELVLGGIRIREATYVEGGTFLTMKDHESWFEELLTAPWEITTPAASSGPYQPDIFFPRDF